MRERKKPESSTSQRAQSRALFYSTTEGRQKFPDILQVSYGEKAVIGFDRYGRALGALVPMEAVEMLAGSDQVDEGVRDRIRRTAKSLLDQMREESKGLPPRQHETRGRGSVMPAKRSVRNDGRWNTES